MILLERLISYFDKNTKDIVGEYNIDHIDFELLKKIFNNKNDDPLFHKDYKINRIQAKILEQHVVDLQFDFDKYIYEMNSIKRSQYQTQFSGKLVRIINCFDKDSENFVTEYDITHVDVNVLKKIIKHRKDDPLLIKFYPIKKKHAKQLIQLLNIKFDMDKYTYDMGCYEL